MWIHVLILPPVRLQHNHIHYTNLKLSHSNLSIIITDDLLIKIIELIRNSRLLHYEY